MTYSWVDAKTNAIRKIAVAGAALAVLCLAAPSFAQQKADIAALNERLFTAVRSNDIATVRSTLTNGADPMAVDANGQTPAGIAIDRGYYEIAHHVLGVRNQRQAQGVRNQEEDRRSPTAAASRSPEVRAPQQTWRDNAVSGQAAEIPSPRIASPKEAVVITPVLPPAPAAKAAQKKGPTAGAQSASTPPAAKSGPATPAVQPPAVQSPPAPALSNLPRLPAGAPNPFDPRLSEPTAPPVISAATPPAPARDVKNQPNEPTSGNGLTRFFNGITGVFGGGS